MVTIARNFCITAAALAVLTAAACSGKKPRIGNAPAPAETSRPAAPAPPPAPTPLDVRSSEEEWFRSATLEELQARIDDVYFDYDRHELRSDARNVV